MKLHEHKLINLKKKLKKRKIQNNDNTYLYDKSKQQNIINMIYLNSDFEGYKIIDREILKKINSYKHQDIKKNKYNENSFIKKEEVILKLVSSKLKCYYCLINVLIMYNNSRCPIQWTLDRINNNEGHNNNNVVICCFDCNIKRRITNSDKFKFTKQLKILKNN